MHQRTSVLAALLFLGMFLTSILVPASVQAQAFWRVEETKTNANTYHYFYENPGTATIRVHMLGAVRSPGLYEVSEDTDLGELIALSGGPPMTIHPRGSSLDVSLRVYRWNAGSQSVLYESEFGRSMAVSAPYPVLTDGDVVVMDVTEHQRIGWRDTTRIISAAGIIALAVERFLRAVN